MGEDAAATLTEIEEARDRLEDDVRAFEARLPATAKAAKRVAGMAVGGGVGGAAIWMVVRRLRPSGGSKRRERARVADVSKGTTVVQVMPVRVPDEWAEALADGRWRPYALALVGLWVLLRVADILWD